MPIWSEILRELTQTAAPDKPPDFDGVRRRYLAALQEHTGRNVVLYASGWLQKDAPPALTSINDEDIHALMEVTSGLRDTNLDLILHSPGGSPEAAEGVVSYLRSKFQHIRVIVPELAMSAATMISCAANEILMGKHSFLGPIDPQLLVSTQLGRRYVPAQAVLDQFDKAQRECQDPAKLSAWLPMLGQYGPDLLMQCEMALSLSRELVSTWLNTYMFDGITDLAERTHNAHSPFPTGFRTTPRSRATAVTCRGPCCRSTGSLSPHSRATRRYRTSAYQCSTQLCTRSLAPAAAKIVENHIGRAFIKHHVVPRQAQAALQIDVGPGKPNQPARMKPPLPAG